MGTHEVADPSEPVAASASSPESAGRAPAPSWANEATVAVPLTELFADDTE
jgi:hypothetical protein